MQNKLKTLKTCKQWVIVLAVWVWFVPAPLYADGLSQFDLQVRETLLAHPEIILEVFEKLERQEKEEKLRKDLSLIDQHKDRLFVGVDDGKPVLVEFMDYNCGWCQKNHAELLELKAKHPDIQILELHYPILGEESRKLAQLVLAVRSLYGEEAYQKLHSAFMTGDKTLRGSLPEYFQSIGLDVALVEQEAQSAAINDLIGESFALARLLGVSGTPGFVTRTSIIRGFGDAQKLANAVYGAN